MTTGSGPAADPSPPTEPAPPARSAAARIALAALALAAFAVFIALGSWQLQRLQWKLALIERVEQRVHAPPVPAPGPERWPQVSAESDEYRHVRLSGRFLHELSTKVQAVTVRGSGYWLLTPLRTGEGHVVLVNRGFIPPDPPGGARPAAESRTDAGEVAVTGLLRMSEPGGGFLRDNDPGADRWFSRDVQAIAAARGLADVAPYFIDADAAREAGAPGAPVGGLTVVSFHNNHLVYALTWYALALMVAAAALWIWRQEGRKRRAGGVAGEGDDGGQD